MSSNLILMITNSVLGLVFAFCMHVSLISLDEECRLPYRTSIESAVNKQLALHPYSTFRDIYKSFMQDYYGPGHLLTDTVSADKYLRHELENTEVFGGPEYEPVGCEGNFLRVNLSLIKDRKIPYNVFFNAFMNSVTNFNPPGIESWKQIWNFIEKAIVDSGIHLEDEDTDRKIIEERLEEGKPIFHHSPKFNANSNFHYRIISRDCFYEMIEPYLIPDL